MYNAKTTTRTLECVIKYCILLSRETAVHCVALYGEEVIPYEFASPVKGLAMPPRSLVPLPN